MCNRGIGMTPNEAQLAENKGKVLRKSEIYRKEFKEKTFIKYKKGEEVIVRNELKGNKMDDEYKEIGTIEESLEHNAYSIKLKDGSKIKRHSSQLRRR